MAIRVLADCAVAYRIGESKAEKGWIAGRTKPSGANSTTSRGDGMARCAAYEPPGPTNMGRLCNGPNGLALGGFDN